MFYLQLLIGSISSKKDWRVAKGLVPALKGVIQLTLYFYETLTEMHLMKFRDNTTVCGCTTKITLIHGVIKLNYGIRLEYCKDCVCDLLQILNLWM